MKIFVIGTRGIPNIQGGVETHCEMLYPIVADLGHKVFVATRIPYISKKNKKWHGVRIINCFAPQSKKFEAIVHTFIALLKARRYHPDVIHFHAIGPALLTPIARLLGFKVVFTNHGPDYKRQKWGVLAKLVLSIGEKFGCLFANEIIVISNEIKKIVNKRGRKNSHLIYNGVVLPVFPDSYEFLTQLKIKPKKYFLAVARFVPEKGLHDLITVFKNMKSDFNLVIAGEADHPTEYSKKLKQMCKMDNRIIMVGFIQGEPLQQLFAHAGLFILPSYHEGLSIALLEAMSHGLSILASDIAPNLEVGLPSFRYFKCKNIHDLKEKMEILSQHNITQKERQNLYHMVKQKYNWNKIAVQTINVYKKACKL